MIQSFAIFKNTQKQQLAPWTSERSEVAQFVPPSMRIPDGRAHILDHLRVSVAHQSRNIHTCALGKPGKKQDKGFFADVDPNGQFCQKREKGSIDSSEHSTLTANSLHVIAYLI